MTAGLHRVYWRCIKGHPDNRQCVPSAYKWEFVAGFVDPDDAALWIKSELNHMAEDPSFEYKIMHMGKRTQ